LPGEVNFSSNFCKKQQNGNKKAAKQKQNKATLKVKSTQGIFKICFTSICFARQSAPLVLAYAMLLSTAAFLGPVSFTNQL
jgi:hypothetical protein